MSKRLEDLQLGHWYWVRGGGARKFVEALHVPKIRLDEAHIAVRMQSLDGYNAWFTLDDVMDEMTLNSWQYYREEMESRGLGPEEWPPESYPVKQEV